MSLLTPPTLVTPDGKPVTLADEYEVRIPNIELVGPRLLILPPSEGEQHTDFGLVIPANAREQTKRGIVLLVGDGVMLPDGTRLPPRVQPGWEVIYANYAGMELTLEGTTYLIIQESDVRVIVSYKGQVLTETVD